MLRVLTSSSRRRKGEKPVPTSLPCWAELGWVVRVGQLWSAPAQTRRSSQSDEGCSWEWAASCGRSLSLRVADSCG